MLLENKSAIIYGPGGSIGGAVAKEFAREGARVLLRRHGQRWMAGGSEVDKEITERFGELLERTRHELLGIPATWTLGYSTGAPGPRMETVRTLFGVGGVGGSFAYGDTARGIGFTMAKNRLAADFETADRIAEIVTKAVAES